MEYDPELATVECPVHGIVFVVDRQVEAVGCECGCWRDGTGWHRGDGVEGGD